MKNPLQLVTCIALLFFAAGNAFAFYCGNKIIRKGLSKGEVQSYCGDPVFEDRREEDRLERSSDDKEMILVRVTIDELTYNFGPSSFIKILIFENGILREINKSNYGWSESFERKEKCHSSSVMMGASKSQLFAKCGEPLEKYAWEKIPGINKQSTSTNREKVLRYENWTYKIGSGKKLIFKFTNSKLSEVRTVD